MKISLTSPDSKAKRWALGVFSALTVGDLVTTLYFTAKWGTEMEGNPLMRWVLENTGAGGFIIFKVAVIAGMWGMRKHVATWVPVGACAIMVPVVALNTAVCLL